MDYKSFYTKFDEIKSSVSNYVNDKKNKNLSRGAEIYDTYLAAIKAGDFSLKSFKAKIIHNELEHRKNSTEFTSLIEQSKQSFSQLISEYFQNYLQDCKAQTTSPTKGADLSAYNTTTRRKRQDVINRINNLEKDYNAKKKEEETKFNEILKDHLQKISENNRRLSLDLQRVMDSTLAEYSELESTLLETDELEQIKNIKDQIGRIRLAGLEQQKVLKRQYAQENKELKDQHIDLLEQYNYDAFALESVTKQKKLEYLLQKKEIDLEISEKSFMYDREYEKKCCAQLKDLRYLYLKSVVNHNSYVQVLEKGPEHRYNFVLNFIYAYIYYTQIKVLESNFYDPVIRVINNVIDCMRIVEETYASFRRTLEDESTSKMSEIQKVFENIEYGPLQEKKHAKSDLLDNIVTSINRYYENIRIEADKFIFQIFELLLLMIDEINEVRNNTLKDNVIKPFTGNENKLLIKYAKKVVPLPDKFNYIITEGDVEKLQAADNSAIAVAVEVINYKRFIEADYNEKIKSIDNQISQYKVKSLSSMTQFKKKNTTESSKLAVGLKKYRKDYFSRIKKGKKDNLHEFASTLKQTNKYYKYKKSVL